MKIKSFKISNFRQFVDVNLTFSLDEDKPFTIITGGNTYGKTTIVKAFLWCLYGKKDFTDKILLNKDIADAMKPGDINKVQAVIEIDHNNYSYKITTKEMYQKTIYNDIKILEKTKTSLLRSGDGGNFEALKSDALIKDEIDKILSPDLSPYFFFDGETNSIETVTKKTNLTNAISEIMGIKRIELLEDYFDPKNSDNVIKRFQQKLDSNDPFQAQVYNDKLDELQKDCENKKMRIEQHNKTIEELDLQLRQKEQELDNNQDILKDQEEKRSLNSELIQLTNNKNNYFNKMKSSLYGVNVNSLLRLLFNYSFGKNDLQKALEKTSFLTEKSVSHITEEAINELIERGYCLCGTKIENGNDAYKHLVEQKNYVEPKNYGKQVQNFIENENYHFDAISDLKNYAGQVVDVIEEIDSCNDRLNTIIKRIEGKPDIGMVQSDIRNIEQQKNQKIGECNVYHKDIERNKLEIEKWSHAIDELSIKTEKNEFIQECIRYAEKIHQIAKNKVEKDTKKIKQDLEKTVEMVFTDMYTGNRKIVINDNFQVSTKLENDSKVDTSKGLETVINFSFVAGLMKLIKERVLLNDDEFMQDKTDDVYPLVMDAPFSNTDKQHITNICLNLPKYCNQIIIVVMEKDYNMACDQIISKVGKKYVINKISETKSQIEEEL